MSTTNRNSRFSAGFWVVSLYFIGLVLHSYPPLLIVSSGTRIVRPDWLLMLPLLGYIVYESDLRFRLDSSAVLALLFAGTFTLSFVFNPVRDASQFVTLFPQLLLAIALFVAFQNLGLDRRLFRAILRFWISVLVLISVYTVYQTAAVNLGLPISGLYPAYGPDWASFGEYSRPVAVFSEPSFMAAFLTTGFAVLLPCVANSKPVLFSERTQRAFLYLIVLALMLSGSISGYLTLAGAVAVFFVFLPSLRRTLLGHSVAAAVAVLVLLVVNPELSATLSTTILHRVNKIVLLLSGDDAIIRGSIALRWTRYMIGVEAWKTNPLMGIGSGQYPQWVLDQAIHAQYDQFARGELDSIQGSYILVLAETGIIGIGLFVAVWGVVLRRLYQYKNWLEQPDQILAMIAFCSVVVLLVSWVYTFSLVHPFRWTFAGLCYGYVIRRVDGSSASTKW